MLPELLSQQSKEQKSKVLNQGTVLWNKVSFWNWKPLFECSIISKAVGGVDIPSSVNQKSQELLNSFANYQLQFDKTGGPELGHPDPGQDEFLKFKYRVPTLLNSEIGSLEQSIVLQTPCLAEFN